MRLVVPAKAGIHVAKIIAREPTWTPAFAGVTV